MGFFLDSEYKSNWGIADIGVLYYIFMFQLRHLVEFPWKDSKIKSYVLYNAVYPPKNL